MSKTFNTVKSILSEARQSQRHALEGHPYHSKSDEQLKFIIKDASEASKAMKTHGTPQGDAAESKYLDQVNHASTVLHFRKQHGTPDWYIKKYLTKKVNESVIDFGKEKESREVKKFHSGFMKKIGEKSAETKELIQRHIDSGSFPMKVGTRFTSDHSRKNKLPPYKITGYYVNPKNPNGSYGYHVEQGDGDDKTASVHMIRDPKLEELHGAEKWDELQKGIKPFERLKSVSESIENIQELRKETLQSYIKKADTEAKGLDVESSKEKDPIKKLKKITKASKRGLGAFKAHLKVREME